MTARAWSERGLAGQVLAQRRGLKNFFRLDALFCFLPAYFCFSPHSRFLADAKGQERGETAHEGMHLVFADVVSLLLLLGLHYVVCAGVYGQATASRGLGIFSKNIINQRTRPPQDIFLFFWIFLCLLETWRAFVIGWRKGSQKASFFWERKFPKSERRTSKKHSKISAGGEKNIPSNVWCGGVERFVPVQIRYIFSAELF